MACHHKQMISAFFQCWKLAVCSGPQGIAGLTSAWKTVLLSQISLEVMSSFSWPCSIAVGQVCLPSCLHSRQPMLLTPLWAAVEVVCLAVFANLAFSCLVFCFVDGWRDHTEHTEGRGCVQWIMMKCLVCVAAWARFEIESWCSKENVCVESFSWSKGKLKGKEKVKEFDIPATTSQTSTPLSVRHHCAPSRNPPYL